MTEQLILNQLLLMPETLKQEALHYILFLVDNYGKSTFKVYPQNSNSKVNTATFGSAKGKYILSDDFDAPIEDFKEYME